METETKEIPFNSSTLLGVKTADGNIWLAVKKTCTDIGLNENQAKAEIKKIQSAILFNNKYKKLSVKFDTQTRKILVLAEKFVPMWLAQINITPSMQKKNPEASKKLLTYQLEAADTLHKAFYETNEQKEKLHTDLNIKGDISDLKFRFDAVNCSINHHSEIMERIEKLALQIIDTSTINTQQQQKLYKIAKDRINLLLGGAHSEKYRVYAKSYFINLWNDFKKYFFCGSYKDLNPFYFEKAQNFIN